MLKINSRKLDKEHTDDTENSKHMNNNNKNF